MPRRRYQTIMYARFTRCQLPARRASISAVVAMLSLSATFIACRGDLLTVPPPPNAVSGAVLGDSSGAAALEAGAMGLLGTSFMGSFASVIQLSAEMADEMFDGNFFVVQIAPDARSIVPGHPSQYDVPYTDLQKSRVQAEQAIAVLEQHRTAVSDSELGQMFTLVGYIKVLLGETACSGVPFTMVSRSGAVTDGDPLPTDSVFALATADFDSALAHASATLTVASLAAVGKGRALLDRGLYAQAGAAVVSVPAAFVYNVQLLMNQPFIGLYEDMAVSRYYPSVADNKGGNGLNYVSAHDPRMPIAALGTTIVGAPRYYPLKFPQSGTTNDPIPLADGVEAGLITAEAALNVHDVTGWLSALNGLRANFVALRGPYPSDTSYHQLAPLADPGTDSARTDLTFRERAFWLYGTAHRLGDLRRLVRQYGRGSESVFPTGAYVNGSASTLYPKYGTNVNFPIGTVEQANPKFHGCLSLGA